MCTKKYKPDWCIQMFYVYVINTLFSSSTIHLGPSNVFSKTVDLSQPSYRAVSVYDWLWKSVFRNFNFNRMTFDDQGFYVNNVFTARADRSCTRVRVETINTSSTSERWEVHTPPQPTTRFGYLARYRHYYSVSSSIRTVYIVTATHVTYALTQCLFARVWFSTRAFFYQHSFYFIILPAYLFKKFIKPNIR